MLSDAEMAELLGDPEAAQLELDRIDAEERLIDFIRLMWGVLHPSNGDDDDKPLMVNWSLEAMCDHLEAVSRGEITKLLINVPPGWSKSLCCNVFWPAWEWGPRRRPHLQHASFSYSQQLTNRDNEKFRRVICSPVYQQLWGGGFELSKTENNKGKIANMANGYKLASSVSGTATGERADRLTLDDPNSVKHAESDAKLYEAQFFFTEVLPTRRNNPEKTAIIVIQQRVSHQDVSGLIIDADLGYEHLVLQMEYEPKFHCFTSVKPTWCESEPRRMRKTRDEGDPMRHWVPDEESGVLVYSQDPRTEDGDLLFPERYSFDVLENDIKKTMRAKGGDDAVAGQLQQRPVPRGGGMFKAADFKIVERVPDLPGISVRGWDLAGSTGDRSPYTVGVRMRMLADGRIFVEDVRRDRLDPHGVDQMIVAAADHDGHGVAQDIPQDPGQAGKAQKPHLAAKLHGHTVHFSPETGSKEARARPFASQVGAGNVYLVRAPWNAAYIAEHASFPRGTFKDQVDGSSRAYARLVRSKPKSKPPSPPTVVTRPGFDPSF